MSQQPEQHDPELTADASAAQDDGGTGDDLANEIQAMLDEANAAMADQPQPDEAPAASDDATMEEIDQLLSEEADDALAGAFETVEQVLDEDGEPQAREEQSASAVAPEPEPAEQPAPTASNDEPADEDAPAPEPFGSQEQVTPAPSDAEAAPQNDVEEVDLPSDDELEDVPGEIQTLDDALDEMVAQESTSTSESETAQPESNAQQFEAPPEPEPAAASAQSLAEELDADEAAHKPRKRHHPRSEPDRSSETEPKTESAEPSRSGLVTRLLAMHGAPTWIRDLIGFIGLQTLALASSMVAYVAAGPIAAMISGGTWLSILGVMFYLLFIRETAAAQPEA